MVDFSNGATFESCFRTNASVTDGGGISHVNGTIVGSVRESSSGAGDEWYYNLLCDSTKTYATAFYHMLGAVVRQSPETILKHEKEWGINVKLFKKLWGVDPYKERNKLASLRHMKQINKNWKTQISIPFEELKK